MEMACVVLTFILLSQMLLVLTLLNPIYDIRKILLYINQKTIEHRNAYYTTVTLYFLSVIVLGMYFPLQNIHSMVFDDDIDVYDKLIILSRVEKNYIMAGFSLFLVVVLYGVRSLLCYTANLVHLLEKTDEPLLCRTKSQKMALNDQTILPNLLRVKRSISYEAILCNNELKDRLKVMTKNFNYHQYKNVLSSIFETTNAAERTNL